MTIISRAQAIQRYGPIDFASKIWPAQAHFITLFPVMSERFPNWCVMNTGIPVVHIACNVDIQGELGQALDNVYQRGIGHRLITYDGCFNIRAIRGEPGIPSAHAYGLALDINAATNQLGDTQGGFFDDPQTVKCFTDAGFFWGGAFTGRKDPMHFSALDW